MNLVLKRTRKDSTGIYGEIYTEDGKRLFKSLEHAYQKLQTTDVNLETKTVSAETIWDAKIPDGTFRCVRGMHALHNGLKFETFMVTGVPGHSGILFHVGNYNRDSEGCILVGLVDLPDGIGQSSEAFRQLMRLQDGRGEFFSEGGTMSPRSDDGWEAFAGAMVMALAVLIIFYLTS